MLNPFFIFDSSLFHHLFNSLLFLFSVVKRRNDQCILSCVILVTNLFTAVNTYIHVKCWFLRRGENRSTRRKTSQRKDENQQQTQPIFDAESRNRTRATLVGGLHERQMLNHGAIPAPQTIIFKCCDMLRGCITCINFC